MKIKFLLISIGLVASWSIFCPRAHAQKHADTAAIIREFNKVMAFAVQPYLSYSSTMTLTSGPRMGGDTGRVITNRFYKLQDDLYYGNQEEEVYLQDSLLIQVNHHRKTIQLGKVDMATRKKLDVLPLQKMDMQKLLRSRYTIERGPDDGDTASILMWSEDPSGLQRMAGTEVRVRYLRKTYLPVLMTVTLRMRQAGSGEVVSMLKNQGFDVEKMVVDQAGRRSLVMTQTMSVQFGAIDVTREEALKMPSWKEEVLYDAALQHFAAKGSCEGYDVVQTF